MPNHTNRKGQTYHLHQSVRKDGRPHYYCTQRSDGDTVADSLPDGYEFYEKPESAQVFLRKKIVSKIEDGELLALKDAVARYSGIPDWATVVDRTRNALIVYASDRAEDFKVEVVEAPEPEDDDKKIIQMPGLSNRQPRSFHDIEGQIMESLSGFKEQFMAALGQGRQGTIRGDDSLPSRMSMYSSMSPAFEFKIAAEGKKESLAGQNAQARQFTVYRYHYTMERWIYLQRGSLENMAARFLPHLGRQSYYELGS